MQSSIIRTNVLTRGLIRPINSIPSLARPISTQHLTHEQNLQLLNDQRQKRPNSPWHIYEPQLPAATSILNRGTGVFLSVGMYSLFLTPLLVPSFDSASLISAFASSPEWFKVLSKTAIAFPMSYHTLNGLRHLNWDFTQSLFSIKESYSTGYVVIASSIAASLGLVFLL